MAQLVTVVCYALQQVVYGTVDSLVYVQVMVMVVSGDDCRCRDGEQGCKITDRKHQTYTVLLGVDQVWPLHAADKKHTLPSIYGAWPVRSVNIRPPNAAHHVVTTVDCV